MPKRKDLATDILPYLVVLPSGGDPDIPNPAMFAGVGSGWEPVVDKLFPKGIIETDHNLIPCFVGNYILHRMYRVNPITWDALLAALMEVLQTTEALDRQLPAAPLSVELPNVGWQTRVVQAAIWHRIVNGFSANDREVVRRSVSVLANAARAALARAVAEQSAGKRIPYESPFRAFVGDLAGFFERNTGEEPTATKSSNAANPKMSPFVEFVWAIMTNAVPPDLREHTASPGAMSKEVSRVLSWRRARSAKIAGPITPKARK